MTTKETYKHFCEQNDVPFFHHYNWWELMNKNWNVLMATEGNAVVFFPFSLEKKMQFTLIRNPHLTPYSGFLFSKECTHELKQKLVNQIIHELPKFDLLEIDLLPTFDEHIMLPEFDISRKITNIISFSSVEIQYANLKPALKRQIKKAERNGLKIVEKDDILLFYSLHKKTFEKQNQLAKIPFDVFEKAWEYIKSHKCGKLLFAQDKNGNYHASLILVYDSETAYYLSGGTDHNYYGSGAMSLLMWHSIEMSIAQNFKFFDFEGSMLLNVNRFFQNFGGDEIEYLVMQKSNSILYKWLSELKKRIS